MAANFLPEQTVLPTTFVKRQRRSAEIQAEMDAAKAAAVHAKNLQMFEGGQEDEGDGRAPPPPKTRKLISPFKVFASVKESREDYLNRAKEYKLSDNNIEAFFREEGLSYSFGFQAEHLMRLGFDEMANVWKVYLKRENFAFANGETSKPSILGFLLSEMEDLVEFLETSLSKIEEGLANKRPYLKPETLVGWKLEQPKDNIAFWTHEDTWYSDSGNCRARFMWQFGNIYMGHLNLIKEPTTRHPNNHGPKVRLSRKEVMDFVKNYRDIIEMTGPAIGIN